MTRSHGVMTTEVLHLLHRKGIAGEVQPGVDEHRSVTSGQDESISV